MAQQIHVTPELMRTTARQVQSNVDDWRAAVEQIYNHVREMDAMWDGLGNDSFNKVFSGERPNFDNLNTLMTEYCNAVIRAAEAYDRGEEEIRGIVSRRQ